MEILEGKELQKSIIAEVALNTQKLRDTPRVVFIMFTGGQIIAKKGFELHCKMAETCGFSVVEEILPRETTEAELLRLIDRYNKDVSVNAIMLLIPCPEHIDVKKALNYIDPKKEIEGLHPENAKLLFPTSEQETIYNTVVPTAVKKLFEFHKLDLENSNVTLVLDNDITTINEVADFVGRYGSVSLLPIQGSLQIAKIQSKNIKKLCAQSDVVIFSTVKASTVDSSWVKDDAVIIDFAPIQVAETEKGPIIEGSIDLDTFINTNVKIFPVLNGIGPIMLSVLMKNILIAAETGER